MLLKGKKADNFSKSKHVQNKLQSCIFYATALEAKNNIAILLKLPLAISQTLCL